MIEPRPDPFATPAVPAPREVRAAEFEGEAGGHAVEPESLRVLSWPRAPAASIGFTLVLAAGFALPAFVSAPSAAVALIAAVPILALAYVARLVFEALAPPRRGPSVRRALAAIAATTFGLALVLGALAVLAVSVPPAVTISSGVLALGVMLSAAWGRDLEQRLGTSNRRIVFIGAPAQYRGLAREIARRGDLNLAGHATAGTGSRDDVDALLDRLDPTTLVLSSQAVRDPRLVAVAARLHGRGVRVRSLHEFYEQEFRKVAASELSPAWFLFDVAAIHDHRFYGRAKRVLETIAASAMLVVTSPLLPLIALVIRLTSPGPIFFRQTRVGLDGELIRLVKFRTMDAAPDAPVGWATEQALRITPFGRFLRRYRLDELPQLAHVVRGDLALVGPRPEQPVIVERLSAELEFYAARHCVRPGLTGWAQVNHGYGGSVDDVLEKLQYEFFYIKHQSLLLDLRILVATVRTLLAGQGR
jgi:exopolysaccharide biosynthesis polyprenyl glycosylphosphotransferase